ncbi:MAG TPA: alpha/beta hydrolase [Acidimicrobiales bacterium]|jgi:pimeloyl-ACP methyl ester carboxylesterase|nr:alpha/beta hydrolase [Acidimicrobiales bacterium]
MPGSPAIALPAPEASDRDVRAVTWCNVMVDGHRVSYATSGEGPAALFLHGWGLRPNAYAEPIRRMGMAGCRVYAPAMPGFGGTRELPGEQRSFTGYAAWVGRFLDAVGESRVALVAGHSFGGGVSTAFVHDHPGRAMSLLLANAIGGPTWASSADQIRTMTQRPVWDWGRYFGTDLLQSPHLIRILPTLLEDFIPNLMQNPLGMFRTGAFIRRADLLKELRTIRGRHTPVWVAWSDRDGLVPRAAFDEVRRAAGVEGVVVDGSHTWLIADPDRFGELAIHALVDSGALTTRRFLRAV